MNEIQYLYYVVREIMPVFIFTLYMLNKFKGIEYYLFYYLCVYASVVVMVISFALYMVGLSSVQLIGFWTLEAPVEWGLTFFIVFYILYLKYDEMCKPVTISFFIINVAGYVYEIPRFIKWGGLFDFIRISEYNLMFFNMQIISIFILIYILLDNGFKIKYYMKFTLLLYVVYCIVYYFRCEFLTMISYTYGNWVYRLPTIIFLVSLIGGLNNES